MISTKAKAWVFHLAKFFLSTSFCLIKIIISVEMASASYNDKVHLICLISKKAPLLEFFRAFCGPVSAQILFP